MWPLWLAILCCGQSDLKCIGCAQCNRFRKGDMVGKSISTAISISFSTLLNPQILSCRVATYLSLNTAPPFELTEITASSKFHCEAADATPTPRSSSEAVIDCRNRMVRDVLCEVGNSWSLELVYFEIVTTFPKRGLAQLRPLACRTPVIANPPFRCPYLKPRVAKVSTTSHI